MKSNTPLFSICVPTRNRAETLFYCLKTLLHQDIDNYEIIVSDNSDPAESEKTLNVVKNLASDKIRYHRPDRVLSMTENFEYSLDNANGEYILFMGDDDGLVVNSLEYAAKLIKEYKPEILKCPGVIYYWPGSTLREDSSIYYPYTRPHLWLNGMESLQQVSSFQINYYILPMIYYAFVKRSVIERVKAVTGTFFSECIHPDIYSGIVLAHYQHDYMISSRPFTIAGLSSKSNGANSLMAGKNKINEEFKRHQNLDQKFSRFDIPYLLDSGFDNSVLFELLLFLEIHLVEDDMYSIDYKRFLMNKIGTSQILNRPKSLSIDPAYRESSRLKGYVKELEKEICQKLVFTPQFGFFSNVLIGHVEIDVELFKVKNVYDASLLSNKIGMNHKNHHLLELDNIDTYLQQKRIKNFKVRVDTLLKRVLYYVKKIFKI